MVWLIVTTISVGLKQEDDGAISLIRSIFSLHDSGQGVTVIPLVWFTVWGEENLAWFKPSG
jgi:hypothetical protein